MRYLLGDNVDFNPVSKAYTPNTNAPTKHSPIIAWANDGFPIYGPFGYSSPSNAASGVRRMVSGFVLRNGQYGTTNLSVTGSQVGTAVHLRDANGLFEAFGNTNDQALSISGDYSVLSGACAEDGTFSLITP